MASRIKTLFVCFILGCFQAKAQHQIQNQSFLPESEAPGAALKFDFEKIVPWQEYYDGRPILHCPVRAPFRAEFNIGNKKLVFIASDHSEKTNAEIDLAIGQFSSNATVFFEGVPRDQNISEIVKMNGEFNYLLRTARQKGFKKLEGLEPTEKAAISFASSKGFDSSQYKTYYSNDFRKDKVDLSPRFRNQDGSPSNWWNQLAHHLDKIRNESFLRQIEKGLNANNEILVTAGSGHFWSLAPALEAALGKPICQGGEAPPNNRTLQDSQSDRLSAKSHEIVSRPDGDPTLARYLEGVNQKDFLEKNPYAQFMPKPFFYAQDLNRAQGDREKTFLIGGINCDDVIKNTQSLTGVSLETLSLRARGHVFEGQWAGSFSKNPPGWDGVGNVGLRSSGEGFLDRRFVYDTYTEEEKKDSSYQERLKAARNPPAASLKESQEALRNLLIEDNQRARRLGLSHQWLAQPLLMGIAATQTDKEGNKSTVVFEYMGISYRVTVGSMGGEVDMLWGVSKTLEEFAEKKRKKGIPPGNLGDSGWTGRGTQGSFFNDEIFSNRIYTFERLDSTGNTTGSLTIDGMTPHLIYRYGFYQGGRYRTPPEKIANFFKEMTAKAPPNLWEPCSKK